MCSRSPEVYFNGTEPESPAIVTVPLYENVVIILVLLFAMLANGLLIFLFLRDHRMQTTTNFFVMSHIASEFFMSCQGVGISLYVVTTRDGTMDITWDACTFIAFVNLFFFYASFLSLTAIAVNRYLAVVKKVHHKITTKKAKAMITLIWLLSFIASLPWGTIFAGRSKKQHRFLAWLVYCEHSPGIFDGIGEASNILTLFWAVVCVGIPIAILLVCFYFILRSSLQNRRQVSVSYNIHHVAADSYARSAFTTLLIIAVYLICNAFIIPLIICPASAKNKSAAFVYRTIIWLRSATYPVVYTLRNPVYFRLLQRKVLQISTYCCLSCQSCNRCLKREPANYQQSPRSHESTVPARSQNTRVSLVEMQRKMMRAHSAQGSSSDVTAGAPASKQIRAWYLPRPTLAFTDIENVEETSTKRRDDTPTKRTVDKIGRKTKILKMHKNSSSCQVVPFEP